MKGNAMLNRMAAVLAAVFILMSSLIVSESRAACYDGYGQMRAARIAAELSAFGPSDDVIVVVGDSHVERAGLVYAQGSQTIGGHPVVFAGIAGATWGTLRDCIPWSDIAAVQPHNIVLMASVNDANTGSCCDSSGYATAAYAQVVMGAVMQARSIVSSPVIVSDPPPESAAGIGALQVHSAARIVYYVATNCGGTCNWATFGWPNAGPGIHQYIDMYYELRGAACTPSSAGYGTPCYSAAGSTMDRVHLTRSQYAALMAALSSVP
jgi:hypothetical protein